MFCVFCLTNTGFVQCYSLGCHKVCCTLVLYFASFSNFCFACYASQTSGLCGAFPLAPVKSVTRFKFCYALVSVSCLTNTGFVQCYPLGSHKVCCTLLFNFALFSNFCFACFASQTSGLCSAFPFGPHQVYTLLVFFVLFSLLLLCLLCPTGSGLSRDFPRLPSNLHALFFVLYYSVLSLCSAFFPH